MRSVAAPVWDEDAVNSTVTGELTSLNIAMGKSVSSALSTVYVSGPQSDMRESDGCMRSLFSAFRNPVGLEGIRR